MASPASQNRLMMSYLFWFAGFLGVSGLHRMYNGKVVTGLIWFFTLGLFGVGQFIDILFVPGMAKEHQLKQLRARYGSAVDDLLTPPTVAAQTIQEPSREEKMVKLLKAAQKYGGQISVTQAVMETSMGFEAVEALLKEMVKAGYASVDNHPKTGTVVYQFDELMHSRADDL